MGGFSCLVRRPAAAGDPTHAHFADQSHSIVDNLVALLGHSRAWNCSAANCTPQSLIIRFTAGFGYQPDTPEAVIPFARGFRRAGPNSVGWGVRGRNALGTDGIRQQVPEC